MKLFFILAILVSLCLVGCSEKLPMFSSDPTTAPNQTTTVPQESTAPPETTVSVETTMPPTTELLLPENQVSKNTKKPLIRFATLFYTEEGQEGQLLQQLPEGYVFAGTTAQVDSVDVAYPKWDGQCFNLPYGVDYYANPHESEFIYYDAGDRYQRLIRTSLKEFTSEETGEDINWEENYLTLFFIALLSFGVSENYYHQAATLAFDDPAEMDLGELFYNGFSEISVHNIPWTNEEVTFLTNHGYGDSLNNMMRISEEKMEGALQRFFSIRLSETQKQGLNKLDYFDKTETYYVWRSDMRMSQVVCTEAFYSPETETYTVTTSEMLYGTHVMTLKKEGTVLKILSNMKASPENPS